MPGALKNLYIKKKYERKKGKIPYQQKREEVNIAIKKKKKKFRESNSGFRVASTNVSSNLII